jgi:hypothetical protein
LPDGKRRFVADILAKKEFGSGVIVTSANAFGVELIFLADAEIRFEMVPSSPDCR